MDVDITLYKEDEIINEHKNLKALYNKFENSYSFNLDVLTKIIIEEEKMILKRINDDYIFTLIIKDEPECIFYLKKEDLSFLIDVDHATYNKSENHLEIVYKIETDDKVTKLKIVKN